jgi:uncharacterized membrane protein (DUF2068 family)
VPVPRAATRGAGIDFARGCRHDGRVSAKADFDPWLRVIALFKLIKSVLFAAAGVGVLNFFDKDVAGRLQHALNHLHVDPDNRYSQEFLAQVGRMTDTNLKLLGLSLISFFYAALFGTEGVGLFLRRRWAEWFVVIVTSTLLPLEIYEIIHKVSAVKIVVTLINLLVIGYLIVVIRRKQNR